MDPRIQIRIRIHQNVMDPQHWIKVNFPVKCQLRDVASPPSFSFFVRSLLLFILVRNMYSTVYSISLFIIILLRLRTVFFARLLSYDQHTVTPNHRAIFTLHSNDIIAARRTCATERTSPAT
jgi:hypothetical protein